MKFELQHFDELSISNSEPWKLEVGSLNSNGLLYFLADDFSNRKERKVVAKLEE